MLASLLPGLRDVRTPLAVGYLWLVFLWIRFADKLPQSRPQGDGVVARLYRLGELGGPPATLAAVSFVAYLLGGLVTLRIDRGVGGLFLGRLRLSEEAARTNHEYQQYLLTRQYLLADLSGRMRVTGRDRSELNELLETAETVRPDDTASLRPRLLVANPEMYGEYDRLAAEASFRINVAIPAFAIGSTVASEHSLRWQLPVVAMSAILLIQGLGRLSESAAVIQRAAISQVFVHPLDGVIAAVKALGAAARKDASAPQSGSTASP